MLILASSSPYRRALLERLGLPFRVLVPDFEELRPGGGHTLEALVRANALGKARSLAPHHPHSLVIGSDQVAERDGRILTKPGSAERAVAQLLSLCDAEHRLWTALVLLRHDPPWERCRVIAGRLRIRPLTRREAEAYVAREQPLDCAGAYKSEGLGITLFDYLRSDDPTAIIGLPLVALSALLREAGCDPLDPGPDDAKPQRLDDRRMRNEEEAE
ncbi:MAG: septum formation protein Maf [Candidatus Eisenbacteria bacterium]|nr:septum formation protein Maf [Candidatus Eisenbacteria bacterium]